MTDQRYEVAQRRFGSFGLAGADPAWSSHVLEEAFSEASAEAAFRVVFEIFGERSDLPPVLARFVRELVQLSVRLRGADLGGADVTWMANTDEFTAAQALLATYLLPDTALTPAAAVAIVKAVEETAYFSEVVIELQDVLTSAEIAPVLAAKEPGLATRIRDALRSSS